MEHLRLDNQRSPAVSLDVLTQHIFHYVWIRGRCSLVELFPIFARKDGFLEKLESLLVQGKLHTDLKSIWAREKQIIFPETPLSQPEEAKDWVLDALNQQVHVVGDSFDYHHAIYINRDFQLQWHKMTMQPGDRFYLGHFEDFRGRIYCKGHILTYQGTDFQKSLIRSEPYDASSAIHWLEMDVARSYGLDKATWIERREWTRSNPEYQQGAKEPFLYKSAWEALQKARRGEPVDHLISLDATASGIQCLALMAQDADSARAVNLGTDVVNNPYRRVKEHMGNYDYERVKQATMTSFYESVATPMQLFGDDYGRFVEAAQTMLPGPWAVKDAIASCMTYKDQYSWTMMDGYEVIMDVTTPVECSMDIGQGHQIEWMEHRKAPVGTKGLTANVTHSLDALVLREVLRRTHAPYQWYQQETPFEELREKDIRLLQAVLRWQRTQFVSFELMDHCDGMNQHLVPQELRDAIDARTSVECMYIQPIHDCYRVRATDAFRLFQIVREVMADLAYARTADWLLPQIGYEGTINDSEERRRALKEQVLESRYLIC
jgi:hypothetical protein